MKPFEMKRYEETLWKPMKSLIESLVRYPCEVTLWKIRRLGSTLNGTPLMQPDAER